MLTLWKRRSLFVSLVLSIIMSAIFAGSPAAAVTVEKVSSPEVAAKRLYSAWKAHSRTAALKVASSAAVNKLFKTRWTGPDLKFMGCEKRAGAYDCSYYYEGGALVMRVGGSASSGYRVNSVRSIAD